MKTLMGTKQMGQRAEELKPARDFAYNVYKDNPQIEPRELGTKLMAEGFEVSHSTVHTWMKRWREQGKKEHIPKPAQKPKVDWEDIIRSVPDKVELGIILLDGIIGCISELRSKIVVLEKDYRELAQDRRKVMQELNRYVAKEKTGGHFTLDQGQEAIVPNPAYRKK